MVVMEFVIRRLSLCTSQLVLRVLAGIIASCLFSFAASGAFAATYYVATTGSDSNAGTSASPFLTIQKGINLAQPGDTVIVKDGTYSDCPGGQFMLFYDAVNKRGTADNYITVKSEHKWGAVLDGQHRCAQGALVQLTSYIKIQDFDMKRMRYFGINFPPAGLANHIIISGNHIHHIPDQSLVCGDDYGTGGFFLGTQNSFLTFDGNVLHNLGRFFDPGCDAARNYAHDHAFYNTSGDTTIINNIFYDNNAGWDITFGNANNHTIVNNTFYGNDRPGMKGHIRLGYMSLTGVVIENNISYNPESCMFFNSTASTVATNQISIKNNIVYGSDNPSVMCDNEHNPLAYGRNYTVSGNITGQDPKFVNITNRDFHLQSGSPAIDRGSGRHAPLYDHERKSRPQGAGYDIGAYER